MMRVGCPDCGWSEDHTDHKLGRRRAANHKCRIWSDEQIREWVDRSRKAQGLPEKITDPEVVHKVAVLLGWRQER